MRDAVTVGRIYLKCTDAWGQPHGFDDEGARVAFAGGEGAAPGAVGAVRARGAR